MAEYKILVVDDEIEICNLIKSGTSRSILYLGVLF